MSDYGLEVYCGDGIKLLSTAEMGVAFWLNGGDAYAYDQQPNSFSQVEFPTSKVVTDSFGASLSYNDLFGWLGGGRGYVELGKWQSSEIANSIPHAGTVNYGANHITRSSTRLLGLSNTLNKPINKPINTDIETYGLWNTDSLISLTMSTSSLHLVGRQTVQSVRWKRTNGDSNYRDPPYQPVAHFLIIPLLSPTLILALRPHSFGVPLGLWCRTPTHEVYVLHSEAETELVDIYYYETFENILGPVLSADYGLEVTGNSGRGFKSTNPPLLPIYAATFNGMPTPIWSQYKVACVYTNVASLSTMKVLDPWKNVTRVMAFNGVKWDSSGTVSREHMGFSASGWWTFGTYNTSYKNYARRDMGGKYNRELNGHSLRSTALSNAFFDAPGVFMGVVAY